MPDKKRGRPTSNPKDAAKITVRLDAQSLSLLDTICKKLGIDRSEAIRKGLKMLGDSLK